MRTLILCTALISFSAIAQDKTKDADSKAEKSDSKAEKSDSKDVSLKGDCTVKTDKDDRVAQGHDLTILAGERVHDAIAIDGDLTLEKGAKVHNVLVSNGKVTVKDGAVIEGDLVVFGGKAKVATGATVKGSRIQVGEQLKLQGEDGDKASLKLEVGGTNLSAVFAAAAVKGLRGCKVE